MRETYGWDVYHIDFNRDLARKSGAVCADVRRFDFGQWPAPDFIFCAPPCIGWSNASKRSVRESKAMEGDRNLAQWSLALIEKYRPRFWAIENP